MNKMLSTIIEVPLKITGEGHHMTQKKRLASTYNYLLTYKIFYCIKLYLREQADKTDVHLIRIAHSSQELSSICQPCEGRQHFHFYSKTTKPTDRHNVINPCNVYAMHSFFRIHILTVSVVLSSYSVPTCSWAPIHALWPAETVMA